VGVPREEERDDAILYDATILGHEIPHAFDGEGRHYDSDCNKREWRTAADDSAVRARAQVAVDLNNGRVNVWEGRHFPAPYRLMAYGSRSFADGDRPAPTCTPVHTRPRWSRQPRPRQFFRFHCVLRSYRHPHWPPPEWSG